MYEINAYPDVLKYVDDTPFKCIEEAIEFCLNYGPYSRQGCGRWIIVFRETKEVLGWCGLKYEPKTEEIDLGYRLHKRYWGKGYATEGAIGALKYGFEVMKYKTIVARARHENIASIRVMQKLGMRYREDFVEENGHGGVCYEIQRMNFKP